MIDQNDIATLTAMRTKYQDSADKIAAARETALKKLDASYDRAKHKILNESQADAAAVGEMLSSLDNLVTKLAPAPAPAAATDDIALA